MILSLTTKKHVVNLHVVIMHGRESPEKKKKKEERYACLFSVCLDFDSLLRYQESEPMYTNSVGNLRTMFCINVPLKNLKIKLEVTVKLWRRHTFSVVT